MKISFFQYAALGIFATLTLVGVGFFATMSGGGSSGGVGKVVIWGTINGDVVEHVLIEARRSDKSLVDVSYLQKDSKNYVPDLINAMAGGRGPDLFMITQDQLTAFSDKIGTISYSTMSQQTFIDSYIDESQLFMTPTGILALPYSVDPLVMYYNRDTLSSAGFANPPQYWSDFLDIAPKLTRLDGNSNVTKSAVAMGGWQNVQYAKDILATLFMQAGDPIVTRGQNGVSSAVLGSSQGSTNANENPAVSALQFFTEFGNPNKTTYSWNRSLPSSQDAFVAGDLAIYFGFASDYEALKARNPNMPIGVAQMPQIKDAGVKLVFGQMTALAIPRTSSNPSGAQTAAVKITNQANIQLLASGGMPAVRRDVQIDTSKDAAQTVFARSAIISRAWLDPDPAKTDTIFQDMIESVMSGKTQPSEAIFSAADVLRSTLRASTQSLP